MTSWSLVAGLMLACPFPFGGPVAFGPPLVYGPPCVPVRCVPMPSCVPLVQVMPAPMVCSEVVFEPTIMGGPVVWANPVIETVADVVAGEDSVTEAVAFDEFEEDDNLEFVALNDPLPVSPLDLGLGWGTATIGPGVLTPIGFGSSSSGFGGFFPGSPNTAGGTSLLVDPGTLPEIPPVVISGGPDEAEPVPEPSAILLWAAVLGAFVGIQYRRRNLTRDRA